MTGEAGEGGSGVDEGLLGIVELIVLRCDDELTVELEVAAARGDKVHARILQHPQGLLEVGRGQLRHEFQLLMHGLLLPPGMPR